MIATSTSRPSTMTPATWMPRGGHGVAHGALLPTWPHGMAGGNAGDQPAAMAGAHEVARPAEAALGRVLVVDDEVLVRRTLALFLTKAGFAAAAVEGGAEALGLLRAGEAFDLLVTDQSMPGMTGCELIGEARELSPGLPALLVSGYDIVGGAELLPGDVALLRKPVERAAFLDRVRALLGLDGDGGRSSGS